MDVSSEVIEIFEGGMGEHEMEVCGGALEAHVIHLRGDQSPARIVGVKWADRVHAEFHDLLESVIGGSRMSRPCANRVVGRVVVSGVPGLVRRQSGDWTYLEEDMAGFQFGRAVGGGHEAAPGAPLRSDDTCIISARIRRSSKLAINTNRTGKRPQMH